MVDFIKGKLPEFYAQKFLSNPKFNFTREFNIETGELPRVKKERIGYVRDSYKGIEVRVYESGSVWISGSIHKFFNGGAYNFNDFHYSDFQSTVDELCSYFEIKPDDIHLTQLEIGVNIIPPLSSKEILDNCPMYLRNRFYDKSVRNGTYRQVALSKGAKGYVKLYDKMTQYFEEYTFNNEILRVERKIVDMYSFKEKYGINTLKDLQETPFDVFRDLLLNMWDKVIFVSPYLKGIEEYNELVGFTYWEDLGSSKSRTTLKRHKDKLNNLNQTQGRDLKNRIRKLISDKITELSELRLGEDCKRICSVTGLNIDMQKKGSLNLSVSGLRYYYKHQRGIYLEVAIRYLSKKWLNEPKEKQFIEIAHNIRNKKSNSVIKRNRSKMRGQFLIEF